MINLPKTLTLSVFSITKNEKYWKLEVQESNINSTSKYGSLQDIVRSIKAQTQNRK